MSNSRPHQRATVYVLVSSWGGVAVTTTAEYRTTTTVKHGMTDGRTGRAAIPYRISRATVGYKVDVHVTVMKGDKAGVCATYFTPRA